jgi:excinuclease ABC subunit C
MKPSSHTSSPATHITRDESSIIRLTDPSKKRVADVLPTLPHSPGCYQFFDANHQIIYIGKAKDLHKRIHSYFAKVHDHLKTQELVKHIAYIDFIVTLSETEAYLLEATLIRTHKPKYNIELKDSVRYAYLHLTSEQYPRILSVRKTASDIATLQSSNKNATRSGTYFGPFVDGKARSTIQTLVQQTFKLRTCKTLPKKVCLQYHLGLCTGPCEGFVNQEQYQQQVSLAQQTLLGQTSTVVSQLQEEMTQYRLSQQFELALQKKNQLESISQIASQQRVQKILSFDQDVIGVVHTVSTAFICVLHIKKGVLQKKELFKLPIKLTLQSTLFEWILQYYVHFIPQELICHSLFSSELDTLTQALSHIAQEQVRIHIPLRGDKKALLQLAQINATQAISGIDQTVLDLQKRLSLEHVPLHIECFDISQLGDSHIVAAKVHFFNGKPQKSLYRKYAITSTQTQNDFASMYEVIYRRFSHVKDGSELCPDLVVIDGGKGQLSSAVRALSDLGVSVPIISLAKKEEEIYFPSSSVPLSTAKDKDSGVRLLMHIRDETHRFVISYHRSLRDAKLL